MGFNTNFLKSSLLVSFTGRIERLGLKYKKKKKKRKYNEIT